VEIEIVILLAFTRYLPSIFI